MPLVRTTSPRKLTAFALVCAFGMLAGLSARADSGFYLGGSVGQASLAFDYDINNLETRQFDEDDFGYKLFGGYAFDLPIVEIGVEGSYVDFGNPSGNGAGVDATGIDAFVVAALDFSIVGVFAKAGVIAWDADINILGDSGSDDGTDNAYGIGLRFDVKNLSLRAEYEIFDIEDTDDLDMLSVGIIWYFDRS